MTSLHKVSEIVLDEYDVILNEKGQKRHKMLDLEVVYNLVTLFVTQYKLYHKSDDVVFPVKDFVQTLVNVRVPGEAMKQSVIRLIRKKEIMMDKLEAPRKRKKIPPVRHNYFRRMYTDDPSIFGKPTKAEDCKESEIDVSNFLLHNNPENRTSIYSKLEKVLNYSV